MSKKPLYRATTEIIVKIKSEIAQPWFVRFLMIFGVMVGALMTICVFTRGRFTPKHVLVFSIVGAMPLSMLLVYVRERLGSGLGGILSGWSSRRATLRETLAADLDKARYSKRQGRFEEALSIINGVLDKDPDFPDALFLKAEILWKSFRRGAAAKGCLRKVMQLVPKDETLHRWASSYYDEVIETEKREVMKGEAPKFLDKKL